jgi:hypothetical protein
MKSVTHGAFLTESIMITEHGAARLKKKSQRKIVLQSKYGPDAQADRGRCFGVARFNEAFADCCPWHAPGRRMPAQATTVPRGGLI